MKKAIVLVEVILSIAIFSIIALVATKTAFTFYKKNTINQSQTHNNLKLESTRLFLIKNNDFSKIKFENNNLYYDNNLLLNKIATYSSNIQKNINTIDICIFIRTKDKICQIWKIKV